MCVFRSCFYVVALSISLAACGGGGGGGEGSFDVSSVTGSQTADAPPLFDGPGLEPSTPTVRDNVSPPTQPDPSAPGEPPVGEDPPAVLPPQDLFVAVLELPTPDPQQQPEPAPEPPANEPRDEVVDEPPQAQEPIDPDPVAQPAPPPVFDDGGPVGQSDIRGIVYTRQPRARLPVPGSTLQDASNWQHVSDVGRINKSIAEADVVLDDLKGNIRVIHNCTQSAEICVAQEARVSPDGSKIAYSVGYGDQLAEVFVNGIGLGVFDIPELTHARIFIHDLATGETYPVPNHQPGFIDRQPEWLDNDTLVLASNRQGTYPHKTQFSQHRGTYADGRQRWRNAEYGVSQFYGYGNYSKSMQIWTMDIDGTNTRNISPHETMALAPMVMTNGDILYSCWNGHGNEAFDQKFRHTNNPGTEVNKWWVCQTDGNGAGGHVVLNGHTSPLLKTRDWLAPGVDGGEGASKLRAVRSVAEIRKDYLAVTNYYRSNHTGSMGIVYGWEYKGPGIEGVSRLNNLEHRIHSSEREGSGRYLPSDFIALTPYGNDQDVLPRRDAAGRIMGKAGYASALAGTDDYMVTHARGLCYEETRFEWGNRDWTGGEPLCQKGIYRVKVDQVTDPFDREQMELIAGGDAWQVFDADAVATYEELWGQPRPNRPQPLSGDRCFLQVVDGRAAELQAAQPYSWNDTLYEQCSSQGCAINTENKEFHADQMHYLTVLEVDMWDVNYSNGNQTIFGHTTNNHGFKGVSVWGFQALEEDGSIRMEVPCETPIQIVGQDESKMTIAHDDKVHSLRTGETRTCHGCHDGHSEERAAELAEPPELRFARTLAASNTRPVANNGYRRTWADIQPILEDNCSSCHADMTNFDGLLQSRIAWDYEQLDWDWMTKQPVANDTFRLPRPYTSKWVAKMARDSLLYWKCMGERMDGRTDRQYPDDIDFGPAHPRVAEIEECQAIGQWIDQGIQRDPD